MVAFQVNAIILLYIAFSDSSEGDHTFAHIIFSEVKGTSRLTLSIISAVWYDILYHCELRSREGDNWVPILSLLGL